MSADILKLLYVENFEIPAKVLQFSHVGISN